MDADTASNQSDPARPVQSRYAPVIERAPLPMVEVEGPDHVVCFVNAAFCALLGQTREKLIGQRFVEIVCNGAECVELLDHVYKTGEAATHAAPDE